MSSPAADAIRASVEALPKEFREPWCYFGGFVNVLSSGEPVADVPSSVQPYRVAVAEHVALLASPDVAEKLADLLDAIRGDWVVGEGSIATHESAAALTAAILRSRS